MDIISLYINPFSIFGVVQIITMLLTQQINFFPKNHNDDEYWEVIVNLVMLFFVQLLSKEMDRGLKEIHVDSITTEQVKKLIEVTSINFMNGLTLILLLSFLLTFNLLGIIDHFVSSCYRWLKEMRSLLLIWHSSQQLQHFQKGYSSQKHSE